MQDFSGGGGGGGDCQKCMAQYTFLGSLEHNNPIHWFDLILGQYAPTNMPQPICPNNANMHLHSCLAHPNSVCRKSSNHKCCEKL